ncbi:MAG: prepilin-type N-terminal cleavage/methylation domain-containing protein, partial [Opitutaceae bacterium]
MNRCPRNKSASIPRAGGFTLIELLIAAAISLLIAGIVMGLFTNVLRSWNQSQGVLITENQARPAFDRLEQDLQAAIFRDDGRVWLVATIQPDASVSGLWGPSSKPVGASLDPAPVKLTQARFGVSGVWLR